MRYNTGNPVEPDGSSSPFDLYDNSGNIDLFANGGAPSWPDRLGRPRKSIAGMELEFANAQADKEERFQQSLLSSGYEDLGDYDAGLDISGRNQVFRKDGELYRASAAIDLPYTTTGDWSSESANFVSVGDAALRQELASPDGADLVVATAQGEGAVPQTITAKFGQMISVNIKSYGGKVNMVDDDTLALYKAMAVVYTSGGGIVDIPGLAVFEGDIVVPDGVSIRSIGKGYEKRPVGGMVFRGTGQKKYSIPGATAISVANPDVGAAYLADSGARGDAYSTLDLSVAFSAAVILGKGSRLLDMGVIPWFDGLAGYEGEDGRLSDEWDVGIWCRNASGWQTQNVICDGHWRKSGLLVTSSPIGDGKVPQCELGQALFCSFGGFRGVSIRAPRNASGASNYGFAGTDFINCFIRSLNHQNLCLATSSTLAVPFPSPSGCLELDGSTVLRGVQFTNCTFMGRDDICVISDYSSETLFQGCYEESKAIRVSGVFQDTFIGSRMVATSHTAAFFWRENTKYAVDFSPYFTKDTSLTTSRYAPATPGAFTPVTAQDSEWERPNFATSFGTRLRQNQVFRIYDYLFNSNFSVTQTGAVSAADNITIAQDSAGLYSTTNPMIRRFPSGTVQIGDGAAALIDGTLTNPGIVRATVDNTYSSGSASFRWSTVFAGTGTINTSDERHKRNIQQVPDKVLDALSLVPFEMYQMDDAYLEKGDGARWHFGVVAQRVKEAFEKCDLDPFSYGLLCYDEWDDVCEPEIETITIVDCDGVEAVTDRETGKMMVVKEAGNRYGIRYEEMLCLQVALANRERNQQALVNESLQKQIAELMKRLSSLEGK
ncbi:hypothetical protein D3C77_173830 [compost metagenome]